VKYEASTPWGVGAAQTHSIRFTITNNSEETITNWSLAFLYGEHIDRIWNARIDSMNLETGEYRIIHPEWDAKGRPGGIIEPGESIVFTGQAKGPGDKPITSVTVNGMNAEVACLYNQTIE
jgi:hypothetical protein